MAYINQKSRCSGQITTVTYLFYCRKYIVMKFKIFFESYLKFASVVFEKLSKAFGKAEIQFLENYTGDFQITLKKDSKLHNNVFSAIKKVGHRNNICPLRRPFWLI
jgi:hypothetical protein